MATAIIEGVIGKLSELAVEQVVNEASILIHFREEVEWLKRKLQDVKGFLHYEHDVNNESVKRWLADVQDIAFDAEDIVEKCVVRLLYRNFFQTYSCSCDSLFFRYKMGRSIRALKNRVESIMKAAADLHLVHQLLPSNQPSTVYGIVEGWKKSSLLERGAKPIAIDAKVEQILNLLKIDALQAIAVVGMGGIGKTFLLQNVYNHHWVREKFDKLIWLSISQVYSVARLQADIASHLDLRNVERGQLSVERAAELIHQSLRDKSSLIVLDDVWRVEGVDSLIQKLGISDAISCKVVVTTRSKEVCHIMGVSEIFEMKLLSEEDSWDLFCHHAFPEYQQNRPPHQVEEVAHQIERECERLPLAIMTVAASMAKEEQLRSWESKLRLLKEVGDVHDRVIPILRLSYLVLPAVLKPCFLYLSSFGEDEEIDAEFLIYSWIGGNFIPEGETQWETGMFYLDKLKDLCLLEVREDHDCLKTCRIHDLLRDLAIFISKENKCAFTVLEASANGCRRILLRKKGVNTADIKNIPFDCSPSLRTLSLSQNREIAELPAKSLNCAPALRVIDLSHTRIRKLPRGIENLKLLRVLNLSGIYVQRYENLKLLRVLNLSGIYVKTYELPDCVRNLKRLCFLDVGACPVPKWIGGLKCLEYHGTRSYRYIDHHSPEASSGISELISLRTLRTVYTVWVLKDLVNLLHLQELHVNITEEEYRSLEEGVLAQLVKMRRLTIKLTEKYGEKYLFPLFPENMKAMKDIEYLELSSFTVPRWICEYGNLKVLYLRFSLWSEYPALDTMPNLKKLNICPGPEGRSLELPESFGKSGAFPQLRSLYIEYCRWPDLQQGALPLVEEFELWRDKEEIPEGFEHLRSLKHLKLDGRSVGAEEEERLIQERFKEGGEYWNRIKANNPHVTILMKAVRDVGI